MTKSAIGVFDGAKGTFGIANGKIGTMSELCEIDSIS